MCAAICTEDLLIIVESIDVQPHYENSLYLHWQLFATLNDVH